MLNLPRKNKVADYVLAIKTSSIRPNPDQPRINFDDSELSQLAESITQNGIIQPLCVRKIGNDKFELISGERRLRAAELLALETVPCIIMNVSSEKSAVLSLIENIQRSDLNYFEEALGIYKLIKNYGITQTQAANMLGKAQPTIANKLRLLNFTVDEKDAIVSAGLSERQARALLNIKDKNKRLDAIDLIKAQALSSEQTENLLKNTGDKGKIHAKKSWVIKEARLYINSINHVLNEMKKAGIAFESEKNDAENYVEYKIKFMKKANVPRGT